MEQRRPLNNLRVSEVLARPETYFESVGLRELSLPEMRTLAFEASQEIPRRIIAGKTYPTYLKPIDEAKLGLAEGQKTIVVEIGGTNMRASAWKCEQGGLVLDGMEKCMKGKLTDEGGAEKKEFAGTADFFDHLFQALPHLTDLLKSNPEAILSVVYSFPGQPVETEHGLDYEVGELTKGFVIPGLEHNNFIPQLNEYLAQKHQMPPRKMALFNDTAILVRKNNNIGEVIGTGFNYAVKMKVQKLREILGQSYAQGWEDDEYMVVNVEAGNLGVIRKVLETGSEDSLLHRADQKSLKPGEALEEKMISGMYLKEALSLVLEDMNRLSGGRAVAGLVGSNALVSEHISSILADKWEADLPFSVSEEYRPIIREACERIRTVSAQVAASLTQGGLDLAGEQALFANIEGSLYWQMPGYQEQFRKMFQAMNGEDFAVKVDPPAPSGSTLARFGSQYCAAQTGIQYFHERTERSL